MDELNSIQYAALDAMGIPVWHEKKGIGNNAVGPEPIKNDLSIAQDKQQHPQDVLALQGRPSASYMLIGEDLALDGNTSSSRLLLAILSASGLDTDDIAIVNHQKGLVPLLRKHLATSKISTLLFFGEEAVQECFKPLLMSECSKEKQIFAGIDSIATYHPSVLLNQPAKKVEVWQLLRNLRDV